MTEKQMLKRKIWELDFAIHELVLYLNTHPTCQKGLAMTTRYRAQRTAAVAEYERKFGPLGQTADSIPANGSWKWINGPWPWENDFTEE